MHHLDLVPVFSLRLVRLLQVQDIFSMLKELPSLDLWPMKERIWVKSVYWWHLHFFKWALRVVSFPRSQRVIKRDSVVPLKEHEPNRLEFSAMEWDCKEWETYLSWSASKNTSNWYDSRCHLRIAAELLKCLILEIVSGLCSATISWRSWRAHMHQHLFWMQILAEASLHFWSQNEKVREERGGYSRRKVHHTKYEEMFISRGSALQAFHKLNTIFLLSFPFLSSSSVEAWANTRPYQNNIKCVHL